MANRIIDSPEGYLLLDESGDVLKNLTSELEYEIHEEPIIFIDEGYIQARYSDNFSGEYWCLFGLQGHLIKKGLSDIFKYIPNRDEFIVIVNENGDSEVLEYTRGGADYWAVIDSNGSYVIGPEFTDEIEYFPKFDLYICDRNIYYEGEFIGCLDKNEDMSFNEQHDINIVMFQHQKKFGLLSTEGIILPAEYDNISEIEDTDFRILTKGKKKAIYNCENKTKSDFIFEFVSSYPVGIDDKESFITKINGLYGRSSIDDSGKHIEKLPHIYKDVKRIVSQRYLTEGFIFQESSTNKFIVFDHSFFEIQFDSSETEEEALERYKSLIESVPV
jgi:hypothetical protein